MIAIYTASSVGFTLLLFWPLRKNLTKASLFALLLMSYHFFFGSIHDLLKTYFEGMLVSRYLFILPASLIFFIASFFWLKKKKKNFNRTVFYLNIVFTALIIIDAGWLISKILAPKNDPLTEIANAGFTKCNDCPKPDIFFIILDGYSGNTALKEKFDFDNSDFETGLEKLGFHILQKSTSNYNYTPFSIASILNMKHLDLNMKTKGQGNLNYSYRMIRDNPIIKFLQGNNYQLYNYSIFDLGKYPPGSYKNILPVKTKLITAQTFISRIKRDLGGNLILGKFIIPSEERKYVYSYLQNNNNFIQLTTDIAARPNTSPKFVYTHLIMPHFPYFFDSKGNPFPYDSLLNEPFITNKHNFIEYLKYSNKQILPFVKKIVDSATTPPIIVILGDHGFRYFDKKDERKYCFSNLSAIYLPSANYSQFYDSISAVNVFPVLFNTEFGQHIPLHKDSTVYLWD